MGQEARVRGLGRWGSWDSRPALAIPTTAVIRIRRTMIHSDFGGPMLLFSFTYLSTVAFYVELEVMSSGFVGLRFGVWAVLHHCSATIEPYDCLATISTNTHGGGLSYQEQFIEIAA